MCSICGKVSTPSGFDGSGRSPGRRVRAGAVDDVVELPAPERVLGVEREDFVVGAPLELVLVHAPSATADPSRAAPRRKSRRLSGTANGSMRSLTSRKYYGSMPAVSDSPRSASAIVVEDLAKSFGTVEALKGVSFDVPVGSVLGLLGPNGAGKTTAVRILTTLIRPDRGRALVLGRDVTQHARSVRASIGLAGQYAAVDENLTARENLRLVGRLTQVPHDQLSHRIEQLLERFDLVDASDRLLRHFSGGMRRRLDLAAALVHEPPVLFLDEPTTGLDPTGRTDLWHVIEGLVGAGTTVLLTTQYLEEADRLADRIVVIDHGSVIAEGTAAQLKARMGATVIEVGFSDAAEVAAGAERLAPVGAVTTDGRMLRVNVTSGAAAMLETVRILDASQLTPTTMLLREPTLDDVFLALTGHGAEAPTEATDGEVPHTRRSSRSRS
jgi:daunorubicin resistance ABC transporter ATP-binding subunit